jgi:DNA-binding NtrC family response regulator
MPDIRERINLMNRNTLPLLTRTISEIMGEVIMAASSNHANSASIVKGYSHSQSIMLIDDDANSLYALSEILRTSGYHVSAFDSPLAALRALEEGLPIDLVITDFQMPQMNGIELTEKLSRLRPSIKIIMLTAHGGVDSFFKAFSLGVFDYLNKPVGQAELTKIVKAALNSA